MIFDIGIYPGIFVLLLIRKAMALPSLFDSFVKFRYNITSMGLLAELCAPQSRIPDSLHRFWTNNSHRNKGMPVEMFNSYT